MLISELKINEAVKGLKVSVLQKNEVNEYLNQNGEKKKMQKINLEDESGVIVLVLWDADCNFLSDKINDGDDLVIFQGYCKEFVRGDIKEKQVVFGKFGKAEINDTKYIKEESKWRKI